MSLLRRFAQCLVAFVLLVGVVTSCSSDPDDVVTASDEAAVQPESTATPAPEPTVAPEPTEPEPEPTEPEPTVAPEPTEEPEPLGRDFSAVDPIVSAFIADKELNGAGLVVVHRDDGIIHHEHWGEFDEDRISLIASSSKMITAGVLLRLADDGVLDIDAPVAEVTGWGDTNPGITTAQLLSNSSGLVGLAPDPTYGPYICQYIAGGTLQDCAASIFTTEGDDEDVIEPDSEFRYGGGQWQVAGGIAEVVSGKSWSELINEIYVEPCGLEALGYNNHFGQIPSGFDYPAPFNSDPSVLDATDNPNMEGGAYVTTGDYAALLLMHLRGGACGDEQVLSQEALDRMHADRVGEVYEGEAGSADFGYGMGWWFDRETERISDGGAYGSVPWLDLDDGYGAYLVVESSSAVGQELAGELFDVVHSAVVG